MDTTKKSRKTPLVNSQFMSRKSNPSDVDISDFYNPHSFFLAMSMENLDFIKWLQKLRILLEEYTCLKCENPCSLTIRGNKTTGTYQWSCSGRKGKNCGRSIRADTLFQGGHFPLQDYLTFLWSFLRKSTLRQCALDSGLTYKTTAVEFAAKVRRLFKQYVHDKVLKEPMVLEGIVEVS